MPFVQLLPPQSHIPKTVTAGIEATNPYSLVCLLQGFSRKLVHQCIWVELANANKLLGFTRLNLTAVHVVDRFEYMRQYMKQLISSLVPN